MPFISCPAAATVGTLRKLVSQALSQGVGAERAEESVYIMQITPNGGGGRGTVGGSLETTMTLGEALAAQLTAGEELALCYSVVG